MKKNNRKALLLLSSALAGVTMLAAVGVMQETQTASAAQTGVFEMMDGAGLRASEPTGIRFIAKFDKSYYDMITTTAADLHVAIVPYTYYVAYEASGETDFYPWLSANYDTYLDLTIPDAKIYQDGGYYYANAVMSNVRMNNYNRDFVGVAYIKDGDTYTEVAISESKNARSVMEVAEKAYRDPEDGVQFKDFLEETIEKGIYSAYGVKYNAQTNEYVYAGNTYEYSELSSVVNVETLQMESESVSVRLNQTLQLQPKVTYANGASYNQELTAAWSSSDTSVATVDQNGVVTGRKAGEAKIYVKALGGRIDGFITVTVKEKDTVVVSEDVVFMAQGDAGKWAYNTGKATVDLTDVPFDLNDVEKITCNGEEIAFTVSGNNVTLTDAPGGDQLYTFETAEADYVIGGCIYGLAISTVEELEAWRTSESNWYAVLLNDIDYNSATLNGGANVLGTLDGRGYQIKNFTTANGFINRLYAAESAIKNVYFKNVTQDCSGWTGGIDRGVLGQWNNGTLENVYLQVHTTNLSGEHFGVLCYGMDNGSKIANVVVEATSDSTKFHYIMMHDYALAAGDSVGVVGSYANGATESSESAWGTNSGFHQQLSWMIAEEANDELLSFTSRYWAINTSERTITMNPLASVALTKTVVDVEDTVMAKASEAKWTYEITNAQADFSSVGVDFSAIESVKLDGEVFTDYTVSGSILNFNNIEGGDHAVTIETGTHIYNATVCAYRLGISTVEELNAWRTTEQYQYAVLLNDIDYQGATLANGANILSTLDGRGHTISNFTVTQSFVNRLYAAESAIKNVYFKNVTQDCSAWTGGIDRGVLGQWNNGTLENVYLQVHTTNLSGEHYGVLCYGMDTGSKIANVVVEVTSASTKFHYIMMHDYALAAGDSVGVVGSYVNGATESSESAWGTNSGFHQYLNWMIIEEANDELLNFTSPYWVLDTSANTITMKPVHFTFEEEEGGETEQPVEVEKVTLTDTYYNEAGRLDLTGSGIDVSAVKSVAVDGEAVDFTASGNVLTVAVQTDGAEYTYVITTATAIYTVNVLACDVAISTAAEFVAWATTPTENGLINNYAVLTNSIELDGSVVSGVSLYGTFDGRGYAIHNLTTTGAKGLFSSLNSGTFKNVQLINYTQDCQNAATKQGLFGDWTSGTVENLLIQGRIINLGTNTHNGVLLHYATGGTYRNIVVYLESDGTAYHYGLSMGGSGTPTASNIYFVSSNDVGVAFNYANDLGTVENCAKYATEAEMLAAVDFSGWQAPWTVNEDGAPYMHDFKLRKVALNDVVCVLEEGKATFSLSELGIKDAVKKITLGGANAKHEIAGDTLTFDAWEGEYTLRIYTKWIEYQIDVFFCLAIPTEQVEGTFYAQRTSSAANFDLSEAGIDAANIKSVTCDGVALAFSANGNTLTVQNAPCGDQMYEVMTTTKKYVLEVCVYDNGLSTADDVNSWRNGGKSGYSVLLNDVDYNGATIEAGAFVVDQTLDGRGYTISNFTMTANFVTRLYNNNAVVKNVYFDNVTQDCASWEGAVKQGIFGNWHSGVIENVYVNITTLNMSGEHYGVLFYGTEPNAVVRNVVVEVESECVNEAGNPMAHYVHMDDNAEGAVVENLVGSGLNVGEGGKAGWSSAASGFHQYLNWMIIEEANDELLSFTSPYWVIDTAANTITMLPLSENKPIEVEDGYLVKDSASAYAIVISSDASAAEKEAVTELQALFKEATGVDLRCIVDSNATYSDNAKYISIGNTDLLSSVGLDMDTTYLGAQGYVIRTQGQSIFIVGQPQGTVYGVYELLHRTLNFEQYTKTVYTLDETTELTLPSLKVEDIPDIENRIAFSGVQLNDETSRQRMRTQHTSEVIMDKGSQHNMTKYIVPFDTYYSSNPKWFSSKTDSNDTADTTQLCYTAGGRTTMSYLMMKSAAVTNIKQIILDNPNTNLLSLTQMDVKDMWCECAGCQAVISQYGEESATQILFINDVVTTVKTWLENEQGGRKVKFMMFAYYETQEAPTKGDLKLHEDVSVWIAPIRDNYMTGVNASGNSLGAMLSDWENVASSVSIWAYGVYFSEYLVPYNNFDQIDQLIDACVASEAEYMWVQGNWNTTQNTGFDSLKAYLISKLMWDSTLDVNTLTDNYFNAVYGAAASTMKTVYAEMKTELASMSLSGNIYEAPCGFNDWDNNYLKTQLGRLETAIDEIASLQSSDPEQYQIIYDAIVCESISFRYIYKENSLFGWGGNYETDAWGSFEEDVTRLGFTMVRESETMASYLA